VLSSPAPYLSLVLACYNEEQHLAASFAEIRETLAQTPWTYEIVFVDDCSRDRTREIVESLLRAHPELDLRALYHAENRGRGATVTDGFRAARGEITGYIDVDLEVHCRYIPSLVRAIQQGADVATLRRIYALQLLHLDRYLMSRGYSALVRAVLDEIRDEGWFWDTEFMVRASRRGLRVVEIPGAYVRREDKSSTVSGLRDSLAYLQRLLAFRRELGR
jgi:glycosyltransferase involved in cell wall biosynthesis